MLKLTFALAKVAALLAILSPPSYADANSPRSTDPLALVEAARARTTISVTYDGAYQRLTYPGGDVPNNIGVCTDLLVRAYRQLGIDLQERVHNDMRGSFSRYPARWGLSKPDPNIDHRRVPNLQVYFTRHGESLTVSDEADDYLPGDLVAWDLNGNGLWHIGVVVAKDRFVHNIGGE